MSALSRRALGFASGAALTAVGVVSGAGAAVAADSLACGDVITTSTTLTADLVCDGSTHGLIIGADDIVLDLGGHTISGPGMGALPHMNGIQLYDHSGVVVQRGTVTGFYYGLRFDSGADNTVSKITAVANDRGIDIANAPGTLVSQSTFADSGRDGIAIGGSGSADVIVSQNVVTGNVWGVTANNAVDSTISRNRIDGNTFGIAVFGGATGAQVTQNTVTNSGSHGIETTDATNFYVWRNTSAYNGGYGLRLSGTGTATQNTAYANGSGNFLFGPGVTDGGGNKTL